MGIYSLLIMLVSLVNQHVHLILKEFVPDRVTLSAPQTLVIQCLLNPLLQSEHPHNGSISTLLLEIRIFHAITGICEGYPCNICSELLDGFAQRQEVASRFAHL